MDNPKIATYKNLLSISSGQTNEELIDPRELDQSFVCQYQKMDMQQFLGDKILVRKTVAEKLIAANNNLKKQYPDLSLKLVYGYRHPEIQEKYFNRQKNIIKTEQPNLSIDDLNEATHQMVAFLEVSGHPTGGAIDITIISKNEELDMGTSIADFSAPEKIKTFYPDLSDEQKNNRKLLHDILVEQGFAPFYGEWWHFSYGDREWAFFYDKTESIYSPIYIDKEDNMA